MLIVLDRSRQLAIAAEPVRKTGCSLAGRYTLIVHDTFKSIDFVDEIEVCSLRSEQSLLVAAI